MFHPRSRLSLSALSPSPLDEVGHVHGHLLDLCVVELLDIAEVADISLGEEVDGYSLPSETAGATDTVDVVLTVGGEIKVDDKTDLLDVDSTGEEIRGDENAGGSGAELAHNDVTLPLVHVSVLVEGGEGWGRKEVRINAFVKGGMVFRCCVCVCLNSVRLSELWYMCQSLSGFSASLDLKL